MKISIRHTEIISSDNDPAIELKGDYTGTGNDRLLGVLLRIRSLQVRMVVGAVDVVSRLEGIMSVTGDVELNGGGRVKRTLPQASGRWFMAVKRCRDIERRRESWMVLMDDG